MPQLAPTGGPHDHGRPATGARASFRRRRGTTSATSSSSTTGPTRTPCVSILPEGLEPHPDAGRCAAVFADWQSCSEGGDELLDPARSHYKEFFIVANALLDGEEVTTCPFIWVDQDFALARGWIQGFPKKLGEVWMTRTFGLGGAGRPGGCAPARATARRASARGREIADMTRHAGARQRGRPEAQRAADRQRAPLPAPGRGPPRRAAGPRARPLALARPQRVDRLRGRGDARTFHAARGEEHDMLAPGRGRRAATASRSATPSTTSRPSRRCVSTTATSRDVAGVEVSPDHFIGGERVASTARSRTISPIDKRVIAEIARGGPARGRRAPCGPRTTPSRPGRRSGRPAARRTCTGSPT